MDEDMFFQLRFDALLKKYPVFKGAPDYDLFILLCIRDLFFTEESFDPDLALSWLTGGQKSGGIDAIFNDPNSEGNDVVALQCKYYENSSLTMSRVTGDFFRIEETLDKLGSGIVSEFNDRVVTAYRNAVGEKEHSGTIRICFVTSYAPKTKAAQTKFTKFVDANLTKYDIDILFRQELKTEIENAEIGRDVVASDKLLIDKAGNCLKYENSVIVNLSARSLQDLENRRRNGILGLNLRYYIKQKTVDAGIRDTLRNAPADFWYRNNGILIICDRYEIRGNEVKLYNFSIVNGGQTTHMIGKTDILEDFYLPCKIVEIKGEDPKSREDFVVSIAESSNAQKPIRPEDLKANAPEQKLLRERLAAEGIYYILKRGEKAPKQYSEKYQAVGSKDVGRVSLAGVLQMPGTAKSDTRRIYSDDMYLRVFGPNASEGFVADLLRIEYFYQKFLTNRLPEKDYDRHLVPLMTHGTTLQLACIGLLAKYVNGVFERSDIERVIDDTDELKLMIQSMKSISRVIVNRRDDEQELLENIFDVLGRFVLGPSYETARSTMKRTLSVDDFTKSDWYYYKLMIKRVLDEYASPFGSLKQSADALMKKQN